MFQVIGVNEYYRRFPSMPAFMDQMVLTITPVNAILEKLCFAIDGFSPSLIYEHKYSDSTPSARLLAYDVLRAARVAYKIAHAGKQLPQGLANMPNRFSLNAFMGRSLGYALHVTTRRQML